MSFFMNYEQHGRIKALDGIRALAIIFVLLRHALKPIVDSYGFHPFFTPFMNMGAFGVDLFFVLSGYFITKSYLRLREEDQFVKIYLYKRILRIFPNYFAALFGTILIVYVTQPERSVTFFQDFLVSALFMQDYLGARFNPVFWSLGVEEKFYLCALLFLPYVFRQLERRGMRSVVILLGGVAVFSMVARVVSYIYIGTPEARSYEYFLYVRTPFHACLEPFLVGIFIAVYEMKHKRSDQSLHGIAGVVLLMSCSAFLVYLFAGRWYSEVSYFSAAFSETIFALMAGGLVFGALFNGGFRWFSSKPMYVVSVLSYSLYLVHMPLIYPSMQLSSYFSFHGSVSFLFIYLALVIFTSLCLYYFVEKPFLKMKDRLF